MLDAVNIPDLTLLFLATIFGLATAFVWMFCELERLAARRRARLTVVGRAPPDEPGGH
ncbi:MAG TPA: hypothetical protein VIQ05_06545 [Tardiphaga sp.]